MGSTFFYTFLSSIGQILEREIEREKYLWARIVILRASTLNRSSKFVRVDTSRLVRAKATWELWIWVLNTKSYINISHTPFGISLDFEVKIANPNRLCWCAWILGGILGLKIFVFPLPYVIMNVIISYEFQQWYQSHLHYQHRWFL